MTEEVNEFWFWATSDGALKTVDRQELVSSLNRGDIPPKAFVWRQGWAEWVRAAQVAELSGALTPAARLAPVMPKLSPDATHPPPVPRADKIALEPIVPVASTPENDKPGTQLLVEDELSVTDLEPVEEPPPASKAPPPPRRSSRPAPPRPGSVSGSPIIPVESTPENDRPHTASMQGAGSSPAAKKLEDSAPPSANWIEVASPSPKITTKSEPAKKLEPIVPVDSSPKNDPPTGELDATEIEFVDEPVKKATSLEDLEAAVAKKKPPVVAAIPRPSPMISVGEAADLELPTQRENPLVSPEHDAIVPVSEPDNDAPTTVQASPLAEAPSADPLPSWSAEVDAELAQTAAPVLAPSAPPPAMSLAPSYPPPKKSSTGLVLGGVAVVGLLGLATVAAALVYFKPWESGETEPNPAAPVASTAAAASASEAPASTAACTIAHEATRIAPAVMVSVPLYIAEGGATSLAVGFADSATSATGITLDPSSLQHQQAFTRAGSNAVVGVVPIKKDGELSFAVDRQGDALKVPHTVDAEKRFVIGMGPQGYSRVVLPGGSPETLWPGAVEEKMTEARVVSVKDVGHAVAFRRGGRDGGIYVGWLTPDGSKKTDLGTVEAEGPRVGTPTVAANDDSLMVTFAARPADDAPWSVRLATAKLGELPKTSQKMDLPAGGPGGEAISPVAVGLPGKRWLVQWTEGPSGKRTVRAQTFSDKLEPLGEPMTLSPSGKEAGQGAIGFSGEHASAFYLVKGASGYELWATSLTCK